jgi:lipopolysaccharide transport system permease protein
MSREIVLEKGRAEKHYWADLWQFRELLYLLAWRDISVRYKQTIIGIAWALLQPILTVLIMTAVFGRIANLPSEGNAPYFLMVFSGILPWMFFASSLSSSSQSLVSNSQLISKVYFPRLIIPASSVIVSFVDFLISFVLLAVILPLSGYMPDWRVLTLPFFMLLAFCAAIGPGLLITALNVKYRDFKHVVPFLVQFGLYLSPVGYSSAVIRERFGDVAFAIYSMNPMVAVIDGFRWAILRGNVNIHLPGFLLSTVVTSLFLIVGVWYFRKMERSFADVI